MKLLLTQIDGRSLTVNVEQIKFIETMKDGSGTHLVFGPDIGRTVIESKEVIDGLLGVVRDPGPPTPSPEPTGLP